MPAISLDPPLFATAFVTVLVIMDPVGNIPICRAEVAISEQADARGR